METWWQNFAVEAGPGMACAGAAIVVAMGGAGSARGIATASQTAAGVLSEKPELFGRLLVMVALPGTQGFYGFIIAILMAINTGLTDGKWDLSVGVGFAMLMLGIGCGTVQLISAIKQGEASAAGISLVARRPEESGRALLFPALVETYAVVALLAAILFINWLSGIGAAVPPAG